MAPSTYYYRRARLGQPSPRRDSDRELLERITAIWTDSRATYGSPRVHAHLARDGIRVGRKRVERLMRQANLKGAHRSRYFHTTESDPSARVAPDLVDRNFHADAPDQLWVADFTYLRIDGGFLFLACVLDVFSRAIVGWSTSDVRNTEFVDTALQMALRRRGSRPPGGLIHHGDRGSQVHRVLLRPTPHRRRHRSKHGQQGRRLRQGLRFILHLLARVGWGLVCRCGCPCV
jgi:putative transposase